MKNILIDSGFWYAYLGTRNDGLQKVAKAIYEKIQSLGCTLIVPFPSLYETVNTKLLKDKNKAAADWFLNQLKSNPKIEIVVDDKYREAALNITASNRDRGITLVDNILRLMMSDKQLRIDALITFNTGDFIDVCTKNRIELVNESFQS